VSPSIAIIADANAGLTEADALALVRGLRRAGVSLALFEQPVAKDDLDGLAALSREPGLLVAADESAWSAEAVATLMRKKAVGAVNIKLMKTGIDEAVSIARIVRAAGGELMIGGMVESSLAMGMSAAFAAGLGGFRFVDLDTPLFFTDDPFEGGYTMKGAVLHLDREALGHGVAPRVAAPPPPR
jgi:L-alanine-DL-glutamate epimerase-like enolase superfamily enzyme